MIIKETYRYVIDIDIASKTDETIASIERIYPQKGFDKDYKTVKDVDAIKLHNILLNIMDDQNE